MKRLPFLATLTLTLRNLPLDIVKDILWHTQHSRYADVAVVIGLEDDIGIERRPFHDEGGLIGQSHVAVGVVALGDVSAASICEVFGFFPVHQVIVVPGEVTAVLHVSSIVCVDR